MTGALNNGTRPPQLAAFVLLCGVAVVARPPDTPAPVLEPVTIAEDFQHDDLGQFASYPPAQDIGYDPSLAPTAGYDAPGGRALMRAVRPTAARPLQLGFIRQFDVVASSDTALGFQYRLEAPGIESIIEVGLAAADGRRYVARTAARTGAWVTADLRGSHFRLTPGDGPLAADTRIEAVYIVAEVPAADPDITYRFLIDDLRLTARRTAQFDVLSPKARAVAAGPALTAERGFARGETVGIEATAPLPLVSVQCILLGPDEREVARGTLRSDGGNRWNHALHVVRDTDPLGAWTAVLDGRTTDGRRMLSRVRFLVTDRDPLAHPRLLFSAADRPRLAARTTHPAMAELWKRIAATAKTSRESGPIAHGGEVFELLDREHLLPSLSGYFDVLNRARARIANNALVAWLEDDEEAIAAARQAMLDVAAWSRWEPPWFTAMGQQTYYPAGLLAAAVALGYDLLYDRLTDDERGRIRRALLERAIVPTWREYVLDNRLMANTSNWISHTVGGAILAAAAIAGDGTAEEAASVHLPLNGLLLKIEAHMAASFLADGSYGEGISYLEFDLDTLGPMLYAVERVLGQSYWSRTAVLDSLAYPLHTLAQPPSESLDQGDTHPPAGHGIGPVVYRSEDPIIRWYGQRFEPRTIWDFMAFTEQIAPRAPSGHGSRLFHVKGNAVFRTGWQEDDAIVLFRAGPTFNHNHNDQGAFLVRNFGEQLATEAGWSDYYKDPYYGTFFTQGVGHNTLLVDGHPESQVIADTPQFVALNRYPRITDYVASAFYDAVGSDLAPVYPRLSGYTRRLAFLKPDLLLVFDRVAADAPARYNVLFHVADRARAATAPDGGRFEGTRATLALRTFSSEPMEVLLRDGRIPYPVLATRTPPEVPAQPAFFDVRTTRPAAGAWVISVLAMQPRAADASALAAAVAPVSIGDWTGVRFTRNGRREAVWFPARDRAGALSHDGWTVDAASWMLSEGDGVVRFGVQIARSVARDGRQLFAAEAPVDAAVQLGSDRIDAEVRSDEANVLRLFLERPPARVVVDESELPAGRWRHASGVLTVPIPAGESRVSVAAGQEPATEEHGRTQTTATDTDVRGSSINAGTR